MDDQKCKQGGFSAPECDELKVFDEVRPIVVVWDEQSRHDLDLHGLF